MLFDRQNDPLEVNNLIDKPQIGTVKKELEEYLARLQARTPADGKLAAIKSFEKS